MALKVFLRVVLWDWLRRSALLHPFSLFVLFIFIVFWISKHFVQINDFQGIPIVQSLVIVFLLIGIIGRREHGR